MKTRTFLPLAIVCFSLIQVMGQQVLELDQLDTKVSQYLRNALPGWHGRRSNPIEGSRNVLIEFWSFPNRTVKVSVLPRSSVQEAKERMESFVRETAEAQELKGFGDEAFTWGEADSNVVLRKGKYTVYITTIAEVDGDSDARNLTKSQKKERQRSEMRRLSKEFAKHVATAIDQP